jgi:hypothetical protein
MALLPEISVRSMLEYTFLNRALLEQALQRQQGFIKLISRYIHRKLHAKAVSDSHVDLMRWRNFKAFDIIGDLSSAGASGCVRSKDYTF